MKKEKETYVYHSLKERILGEYKLYLLAFHPDCGQYRTNQDSCLEGNFYPVSNILCDFNGDLLWPKCIEDRET